MDLHKITIGRLHGHGFRRLVHVFILLWPFIYYTVPYHPFGLTGWTRDDVVFAWLIFSLCLEIIRIRCGLLFVGQREYERHRMCAFAWGTLAIGLVVIYAPSLGYAFGICGTCALADPVMGECRCFNWRFSYVFLVGWFVALLVWAVAWWFWQVPIGMAVILSVAGVLSEFPRWQWIDDNALMQLVPLVIVLLNRL